MTAQKWQGYVPMTELPGIGRVPSPVSLGDLARSVAAVRSQSVSQSPRRPYPMCVKWSEQPRRSHEVCPACTHPASWHGAEGCLAVDCGLPVSGGSPPETIKPVDGNDPSAAS